MAPLLIAIGILAAGFIVLGLLGDWLDRDAIDRHERTRPAPMARFGPNTRRSGR